MLRPLSLLAVFLLLMSCGRQDKKDDSGGGEDNFNLTPTDDFGMTAEGKRWWIDKASRTLRMGASATDAEMAEFSDMPYDAIADRMMADTKFADVLLDFNYYYFGLKSDKRVWPDADNAATKFFNYFDVPQAIHGAKEVLDGGDILAMLDSKKLYAEPFGAIFDYEKGQYVAEGAADRRKKLYATRLTAATELIDYLSDEGEKDLDTYCLKAMNVTNSNENFDPEFPTGFREALFNNEDFNNLTTGCFDGNDGIIINDSDDDDDDDTGPLPPTPPARPLPDGALARAKRVKKFLKETTDYFQEFEPDQYQVKNAEDVRELDLKRLGIEDQRDRLTMEWFFERLPNSSTNYNRKRGNYVLKRFFCDDLTPVNVILPTDHAGGKHGSDPGCQSCHYKLDPMSGFFRYQGGFGGDIKGSTEVFFSDGATKSLKDYLKEWQGTDGKHAWSVGYVRSTTDDSLNDYSDHPNDPDLTDLFKLLQRAPEVKQCLVKRLAEYVVGDHQAMDPGYLAGVTQRYEELRKTAPGAAFKDTFKTLVLSKTFRTQDPASEECYDTLPGTAEGARPPCKVAFILERHCAQCHRGVGAAGGLDLTKWEKVDDGFSFPDTDGPGRVATMQGIYDRLATSDAALKMPLNKYMDVADRDALFLWVAKQMNGEANAN